MIGKKIYSFKAIGGSRLVTGRVCAENMKDATNQVLEKIKGQGQMNVNVTELRNQNKAMKEWIDQGVIHEYFRR
jgi:hypothetical protein